MSNVLQACLAIAKAEDLQLTERSHSNNRINQVGNALEDFVKDIFANTLGEENEQERSRRFDEVFSYRGSKNHPPDVILKNGDAIEVKKIKSPNSELALNSSHPKAKLFASNPRLKQECRDCESWSEKDIIYVVGHVEQQTLKSLWMVYGDCYAANEETYQRIATTISRGITSIPNVECAETIELGRINKVDPLSITDLRIREMESDRIFV